MRKLILTLGLSLILPSYAVAQQNPCLNIARLQNVAVNISTATTTRIIDGSSFTDQGILVCGMTLGIVGAATAQTIQFTQGTGATCGTATINLSGAIVGSTTAASTTMIVRETPAFSKIPTGTSFCIITTQAVIVTGMLTYVVF